MPLVSVGKARQNTEMTDAIRPDVPHLIGISYRTAPAELRDHLQVDISALPGLHRALRVAGWSQAVPLHTCDRVVVAGLARPETDASVLLRATADRLAEAAGQDADELDGKMEAWSGYEAVRQIFAIASSLDSQVIGEPHVLGQVRAARRAAACDGLVGPSLAALFDAAQRTARRVRHETRIAEGPVSIVAAARRLAEDLHGPSGGEGIALIGAGEMGELLLAGLATDSVRKRQVIGRTERRAAAVASSYGARPRVLSDLPTVAADSDILIAALGDGGRLLNASLLESVLKQRRHRPILVLDVAIPSDVSPEVDSLDGIFRYGLNDLERIAVIGMDGRQGEAAAAWRIVDEETRRFLDDVESRAAGGAIQRAERRLEQIRETVLAAGGPVAAEPATRLFARRLLHCHAAALRRIAIERPERLAEAEAMLEILLDEAGGPDDPPEERSE